MSYDRKNDEVRTEEVNSIFSHIAYLNKVSGQNEPGQNNTQVDLSDQVGRTGQISNNFIKDLRAVTTFYEQVGEL